MKKIQAIIHTSSYRYNNLNLYKFFQEEENGRVSNS